MPAEQFTAKLQAYSAFLSQAADIRTALRTRQGGSAHWSELADQLAKAALRAELLLPDDALPLVADALRRSRPQDSDAADLFWETVVLVQHAMRADLRTS